MSSSSLKFDYDSSSSDSMLSMTKSLLDEPVEDDGAYSKRSYTMIRSIFPMVIPMAVTKARSLYNRSSFNRRYIYRDRISRHNLIMNDYFKGEKSKYSPEHFRRRFRMDIDLFKRILQAVENYDDYFTQKFNAARKPGLSPLQKVTTAVRMLAYGCAVDALDEYVQIGETTAIKCLKRFCDAIIGLFEERYLRKPNKSDIEMLLKEGEARGFPGMLGSLDCMHWHWKNCLTAWHGTHTNGFKKVPTLILEAVASQSLWIWHAFFGMAGTNNDINVLDRSPLFDELINDVASPCNFIVQGHQYDMGYYLSDGIYPQYATLIQTISEPSCMKEKTFSKHQEAVRKDVERAFGVLQSRCHIIKGPARMWRAKVLGKIMKTCIILHNMIIENEHSQGINPEDWQPHVDDVVEDVHPNRDYGFLVSNMINRMKKV